MKNYQLNNFVVLSLLLLFSVSTLNAAHIIGGDMTYRCIEVDSINQFTIFEVVVTMYRDSKGGGADFDDPARFGVYRGSGFNWELVGGTIRRRPQSTQALNNVDDPCITIPPNVGVESATYTFELQLDWIDENYKVAYQRCCRNNTVSNLLSPQSTGAVFEIDITPEAQRSCNNSPTFNKFPPIVLCAGEMVNVDISGTDIDGDQILYEFCVPKSSGGQMPGTGCDGVIPDPPDCLPPFGNAVFLLPNYTVDRPLGPDAQTSLDPNSGILTITPNVLGQFVVGVCIKEFRNGQIISEVTRDFQFNVASCINLVTADLEINESGTTSELVNGVINIESCFIKDIQFENLSSSLIGSPTYLWEFINRGDTIRDNSVSPTLTFPDIGTFNGVLIVNPEAGVCSDTAEISVTIHPELIADFSYDYDTCIAGPVEFYDNSKVQGALIDQWKWALTLEDSTDTQNPIHRFETPGIKNVSLIINDSNECTDTISKEITWVPVPDVLLVEPSEFEGCVPATIDFNNLSSPIDETYMINWSFGDGTTDSLLSPSHTYLNEGIYDVFLQIISPEGCEISRSYPELISISPEPEANFTFEPKTTTILNPIVSFSDSSNYVKGHQWYVNGEIFSFEQNPTFTFMDTGLYIITLQGYHEFGCVDTIEKLIDIQPFTTFHVPNAFTPNNDGLNDEFLPKGLVDGIKEYHMSIWNRWGEEIYESDDIHTGWNGQQNNNGKLLPAGVYVYTIQYSEPRGEKKSNKGHVTLIR